MSAFTIGASFLLLPSPTSSSLTPPPTPLQVIRELREEVEKLRTMLTKGGGEEGPTGTGNQELVQLKDKLKISETLMAEMSKSWEQKLAETERIHKVMVLDGEEGWYWMGRRGWYWMGRRDVTGWGGGDGTG